MKKFILVVAVSLMGMFTFVNNASANLITYEALPANNSNYVSRHGVGGPVLADDFNPAYGGSVVQVDWWGSGPLTGRTDQWEITFHNDAGGVPAATGPGGGISQHFVNASGSDLDGDGIYLYTAVWNPQDILITAGVDYWFSVANASGSTWTWATGLSPTVGSEQYSAVVSTGIGPNGGPHFGPWNAVGNVDFAYRVHVVPEPASLALMGLGLVGLGFARRKKAA